MSKKTNSLLFMLLATLVNIVLLALFFIVLGVIMGLLVSNIPGLAESSVMILLVIILFVGSIGGSFFVYSKLVKWATVKFDLENNLDPLFTPKRNRIKRGE